MPEWKSRGWDERFYEELKPAPRSGEVLAALKVIFTDQSDAGTDMPPNCTKVVGTIKKLRRKHKGPRKDTDELPCSPEEYARLNDELRSTVRVCVNEGDHEAAWIEICGHSTWDEQGRGTHYGANRFLYLGFNGQQLLAVQKGLLRYAESIGFDRDKTMLNITPLESLAAGLVAKTTADAEFHRRERRSRSRRTAQDRPGEAIEPAGVSAPTQEEELPF